MPGTPYFSVGMVIRDHQGALIRGRTSRIAGVFSAFEAEVWGIRAALRWLQMLQVKDVEIECDSLLTVTVLHKESVFHLEVGFILQDCFAIFRSRPDFTISYVRKQANTVAHFLARVPCLVNSSIIFLSPPPCVMDALVYDSNFH